MTGDCVRTFVGCDDPIVTVTVRNWHEILS